MSFCRCRVLWFKAPEPHVVSLWVDVSTYLYICIYIYIYRHIAICRPLSLFFPLFLSVFVCVCVCVSLSLSLSLSLFPLWDPHAVGDPQTLPSSRLPEPPQLLSVSAAVLLLRLVALLSALFLATQYFLRYAPARRETLARRAAA